jgi:hypothetical protein
METQKSGSLKFFDFGNSFVMAINSKDNNPRFLIESKCTVIDRGKTEEYYLVEKCKGENTYAKSKLFVDTSFGLFPIFNRNETLAFRKFKYFKGSELGEYKRRYDKWEIWGDKKFIVREVEGELIDTSEKIIKATEEGRKLMGRLRIKKGIEVIIDFPIKTINTFKNQWQVDTGYIPYPDFYKYPVEKISSFGMGFIIFNNFNVAEVATEGLMELIPGCQAIYIATDKDVSVIPNPEIYIYAV